MASPAVGWLQSYKWKFKSFSILGAVLPSGEGIRFLTPAGRIPRGTASNLGEEGVCLALSPEIWLLRLASPFVCPSPGRKWSPTSGGGPEDSKEATGSDSAPLPFVPKEASASVTQRCHTK